MQNFLAQLLKEMSPLEIVAAITSLLCVYLTVKNNIWNWLWGIIGVCLYGYVFYHNKLYANAGLQIFYFLPMQFIGWYVWLRGGPNKADDLPITALSNQVRAIWAVVTVALTAALFYGLPPLVIALHLPPPQLSFWDSLTTAMSIVAQYFQTVKKFENWVLWIAADVIYCYLFPQAHLWITTALYVIFTILAITGAREWHRLMKKQAAEASAALPEDGDMDDIAVEESSADTGAGPNAL